MPLCPGLALPPIVSPQWRVTGGHPEVHCLLDWPSLWLTEEDWVLILLFLPAPFPRHPSSKTTKHGRSRKEQLPAELGKTEEAGPWHRSREWGARESLETERDTGLTENAPKTLHKGLLCNPWLSLVRISYVAITTTTTEICVLLLGCRCIHAHWQGMLSSPRTLADGALSPCVFSWVSGRGNTPTGNTVL